MRKLSTYIGENFYNNVGNKLPQSLHESYEKLMNDPQTLHYNTPSKKRLVTIPVSHYWYEIFDEDKLFAYLLRYYINKDKVQLSIKNGKLIIVDENNKRITTLNSECHCQKGEFEKLYKFIVG